MAIYNLGTIDHVFQTFNTRLNGITYAISLRFLPNTQHWILDVSTPAGPLCQGQPCVLGVPILQEAALDVVFFLQDASGESIDPILPNDFGGRITLWIADNDEELLRAFVSP